MQADFKLAEKRQEKDCRSTIRSKENNLGWYLKNSDEYFLLRVDQVVIVEFNESVSKRDFIKLLNEKRVENWKEK